MAWFNRKEICTHCNTQKTRREFEGRPTCGDCEIDIKIKREDIRKCPVDGATMGKELLQQIIIDRCPNCGGVWLDAGELKSMQSAIEDEASANGFVMGMIIN